MAVFFGYTFAIFGTQSTLDGDPVDYRFAPSGTWRYSGDSTYFVVEENDGATYFNGDGTNNEQVDPQEQIGGIGEQTTNIGGTDTQLIWDYTFSVSDGLGGVWTIGVIDVDLDNSDTITAGAENGYFLVFPDGMPPPDTDLTVGGITENGDFVLHSSLGGDVVCFAEGTLIETMEGPAPIETLREGDMILTRDAGFQPLVWSGFTAVAASGSATPVVIRKGAFGNSDDLVVSPQHAILLDDWRAELLYGQDQVLVRAIDLLGCDGVYQRKGGVINYWHILLPAHHVVLAAGLWSESLFPGDITLQTIGPRASSAIKAHVPDITAYGPKATLCLRKYEASLLPGGRSATA